MRKRTDVHKEHSNTQINHQSDEVEDINKGWNIELEKLIVDIEDKSWAYTWMHNSSVNYLSKWNDKMSIANIALSILTGTSTFATLNTCSTLLWVQVVTGFFIYLGAFIAGYQKYHRFEERVEKHKQAASKYSGLYHNIQAEIGLRPHERQRAKDYVTWATNQYDALLLSSPEVDDKILKMYFDLYKGDQRGQPVIYNYHKGPIIPISDYIENHISKRKKRKHKSEVLTQDVVNETTNTTINDIPKTESIHQVESSSNISTEPSDKPANNTLISEANHHDEAIDSPDAKPVKVLKTVDTSSERLNLSVPIKATKKKRRYRSLSPQRQHIDREEQIHVPYVMSPPPQDFRELKSQLLNRNKYNAYFHQYDDRLMQYQIDRMNTY